MADPDRPPVELTPEFVADIEQAKQMAVLDSIFYGILKGDGLPDQLIHELTMDFQERWLEASTSTDAE